MRYALPKAGRIYFSQLRHEYLLRLELAHQQPSPTVLDLFQAVDANPKAMTWADVFALELAKLQAVPDAQLADQLLLMRGRYRDVIGNDAYALYAQTTASDLGTMTPTQLRAELFSLAQRLHYIYLFDPPKESVRTKLAIWAALLALISTVTGVAVFYFYVLQHAGRTGAGFSPILPVILAMFAGQVGGFISVQQRLQAATGVDPLFKEMQLSAGWFSVVIVAPLTGAVFALVLYLMFAGELLKGGVFPDFASNHGLDNNGQLVTVGYKNWGLLLVWCFLAGFAERFVPDVLTRLTGNQYSVGGDQPGGLRVPTKGQSGTDGVVPQPESAKAASRGADAGAPG
jgi:hypothetical protein